MKIILASASPRRRELLGQMNLTFEVLPSEGEEVITKQDPSEVVMELASQKASEVAERLYGSCIQKELSAADSAGESSLIIGADTVVVKDGQILGKPKDTEDAVSMLQILQGSTHQVYTGVCLIRKDDAEQKVHTFYECTEVEFYPMTEQEIHDYVATGEPMDKAGAYGIQGRCAIHIRGIRGDYNNVVGLPIARLYQELQKI